MLKQKFTEILAYFSRKIIAKYKPRVIGITGSVGKTSAKEAIGSVLSERFSVRKPEKNFNNEFGVPFTIIGVDSPGRSVFGWLAVFAKATSLVWFTQPYPEILILEMGVDRVGDMDYLVSLAKPDVSVITNIGLAHYEFFKSTESIALEKGKLASALTGDGVLVVNFDNPLANQQREKTNATVLSYSIENSEADIFFTDKTEDLERNFATKVMTKIDDQKINLEIHAVGSTHLSAISCALAVAKIFKLDGSAIIRGVSSYRPAPSRMSLIKGIKHNLIIDDTYNSSPDSVKEGLKLLSKAPQRTKIVVLGDMLELGEISEKAHEEIGQLVAQNGFDLLITVGVLAKIIGKSAGENGMAKDRILSFDGLDGAVEAVEGNLKPDGVLLIKGSQGIRMEKIVKEIMAEPSAAKDLLCRQYGKWV